MDIRQHRDAESTGTWLVDDDQPDGLIRTTSANRHALSSRSLSWIYAKGHRRAWTMKYRLVNLSGCPVSWSAGPGLRLDLDNGKVFVITIDEPQTGAAVLNREVQPAPTRTD